MERKYKAVLHGDRVEWIDGKPNSQASIEVEISVQEEPQLTDKERRAEAAAALRKIAEMGGTGIKDPVAWQREIRKDRPDDEPTPTQGEELARLLGMLADKGTFADIKDPVAWQREQRKDRPLPGRES